MDNNPIYDIHQFKNVKGMIMASLNIRSIFKHLDEVDLNFRNSDIDVLCLQESFLNSYVSNNLIDIANYNLYRFDRDSGLAK